MTNKNPYRKNSKLDIKKSRKIMFYFCEDMTATLAGKLLHIERKTVNDRYNYMRNIIYEYSENEKNEVLK